MLTDIDKTHTRAFLLSDIQRNKTTNTIKFYVRYVDDTLLMIKPTDIERVHHRLNKFDKNVKFTIDTFE